MKVRIVLKELLDARGLNQKQLAELSGIRQAAISSLCRGYVDRLSLDHLEKIASALDVKDIRDIIRLEAVA